MRDKLYAMGLIETFCFIYTNDKDWWFIEGNMLIYTDELFLEKSHITTAGLKHA